MFVRVFAFVKGSVCQSNYEWKKIAKFAIGKLKTYISMRIFVAIITLFVYVVAWAQTDFEQQLSATRYDYSQAARQITAGCSSKYEQAKAIYRWLCDNISYDTSRSIYTADECWDKRRGVCQAYSELFYRLAEPIGLRSVIVRGIAKSLNSPAEGHAWIFAIVEEPNTGIIIDPTWGAGSVDGSVFIRSDNDDSWFHVDPYWMIFTHFPDDPVYQFLPQPISRSQFDALPDIKPTWGEYGFDAKTIYNRCMSGDTDLPCIYVSGAGKLRIVEMPMQKELRIGENYRFAVQKLQKCNIALIDDIAMYGDWQLQGNTYYIDYMPATTGKVHLGFNQTGGNEYSSVVVYEVPQPNAYDLAKLEAANPFLMPEITSLPNFDLNALQKYGVDGKRLLAEVRKGSVKSLPKFYASVVDCNVEGMPLSGVLKVGQSYTFKIKSRTGMKWAIINGKTWYREWATDASDAMYMTVVPENRGELVLAVQQDGDSYKYFMCYTVQ